MSRKAGVWIGLIWGAAFCFLAVAGGGGAGYFKERGLLSSLLESEVVLNEKYSFTGPVKQEDLRLTRSEIVALNNDAWRTRNTLASMNIHVEIEQWNGRMDSGDMLQYTFVFGTTDGAVVKSWQHVIERERFVDRLEQHMDMAVEECRRCRNQQVSFKVLYI